MHAQFFEPVDLMDPLAILLRAEAAEEDEDDSEIDRLHTIYQSALHRSRTERNDY